MLKKIIVRILPMFLLVALPVFADGTAQVFVNGQSAFQDHGVSMSPYGGTLNGQPASFICVQYDAPIHNNSGWTADVTSLISPDGYGNTVQQNQTTYLEFAYLATQLLASTTEMQAAEWEWALFGYTGGLDPYGTNAELEAQAAAAVAGGFTVSGWTILTPTPLGSYGQEFLVAPIPEPSELILLSVGLLAVAAFSIGRKRSMPSEHC